jgi:hypothetical protein
MPREDGKIEIENAASPGRTTRVDAVKYTAVKTALLAVLPEGPTGLTFAQMKAGVAAEVSQALFPGGDKLGWWLKGVQLDLEAKGIIRREDTKPLTFRLDR